MRMFFQFLDCAENEIFRKKLIICYCSRYKGDLSDINPSCADEKILKEIDMTDPNSSHANSTDQYDTRRQKSFSPGHQK